MPQGSSGTGLDQLVGIITTDTTLLRKAGAADVAAGASAADALNHLIVQAIRATGVANNGDLTVADLYAVNAWLRSNRLGDWTTLHGDDECNAETGFHRVQNDGASGRCSTASRWTRWPTASTTWASRSATAGCSTKTATPTPR
jgi:hypothetical protein